MSASPAPRDQPPPVLVPPLIPAGLRPPIPPPLPAGFAPAPIPAGTGRALARGWGALGWKGKLLVVGSAYLAVNLLVVAFAALSQKPANETPKLETFSAAPHKPTPPHNPSPQSTATPAAPRFRYTVTDLGTLGGQSSEARGINNRGQVVGEAQTSAGRGRAFLWDASHGMKDLGTLGGAESYANGINDAGQVVGRSDIGQDDWPKHAFLWEAGRGMQDLGTLGGYASEAHGINSKGQVVGGSVTFNSSYNHAFLWEAERGMRDLGTLGGGKSEAYAINDSAQIVGGAASPASHWNERAFLWEAGRGMQDLGTLGGKASKAYSINGAGQVVGYAHTSSGIPVDSHAFLWDRGHGMKDLDTLRPTHTDAAAYGVNNAAQAVVVSVDFSQGPSSTPETRAFLYCNGKMIDLTGMIDQTSSGLHNFFATAINDHGQIVGSGKNKAGHFHAFLLTPVSSPEPTPEAPAKPATVSNKPCAPSGGEKSAAIDRNLIRQQARRAACGFVVEHVKNCRVFKDWSEPYNDATTVASDVYTVTGCIDVTNPLVPTAWGTYHFTCRLRVDEKEQGWHLVDMDFQRL